MFVINIVVEGYQRPFNREARGFETERAH
jgi:hypothetical protein